MSSVRAQRRLFGEEAITEKAFQAQVRELAGWNGWEVWHVLDSRGMRAGWPDLTMLHPRRGRIIYRELKAEKGRVTAAQRECLAMLVACGQDADVWRPSDWDRIVAELGA